MTSASKNVYIDKLDDMVIKYNNTYQSTVKMKPINVKSNTYIDSSKEINGKNPEFKIGDIVKISKYKNVFPNGYTPDWPDEVFMIKKLKILCCGHMFLMILMEKKLLDHSTKKNCKRQVNKSLELKK